MTAIKNKDIFDAVVEVKSDVKNLHGQVDEVKEKTHQIEVVMVKNTKSLEAHARRTDILEEMIKPIYEERLTEKAIREYKKRFKADLLYKLRLPAAVVALAAAFGTGIAWVMGLF